MTQKDPIFYTKDGFLTKYAFACGYVKRHTTETNIETVIYMEHNHFHVIQHDHQNNKRIFWDTFDTLTPAKKRYLKAIGKKRI